MADIVKFKRLLFTFTFICLSILLFRPFIVRQIVLKGDGYISYCMYRDAVRQYKKALVLDPGNNEIRNWLGYTYKAMGDVKSAVSTYKKTLKIDPQNITAYHDLGMIYAKEKDFKLAKNYFFKAASLSWQYKKDKRRDYELLHNRSLEMLSICQERLGEIEEAIKTCEKILEYYPDSKITGKRIERLKNYGGDIYEKPH